MEYKLKVNEVCDHLQYHDDFVDATMYAISSHRAKIYDEWVGLHLRRPRWMPSWLFKFLVKKFVVIDEFRVL